MNSRALMGLFILDPEARPVSSGTGIPRRAHGLLCGFVAPLGEYLITVVITEIIVVACMRFYDQPTNVFDVDPFQIQGRVLEYLSQRHWILDFATSHFSF